MKTDYAPQWDKDKPNHSGQNDRLVVCSILFGFWALFCLYLFKALTEGI